MEKDVKIKIERPFVYKAYQLLKDVKKDEILQTLKDANNCKFLFKSECHYYVEKFILDFIKTNLQNLTNANNCKFTLIKVYDSDILTIANEIINVYEILQIDNKLTKICIR